MTNKTEEVAERSEVIFLCTKPQQVEGALADVKRALHKINRASGTLVVSICAGITIDSIETQLAGTHARVVIGDKESTFVLDWISCDVGEMGE